MRLRHIEVFHAVYNTGSISDAARLLHVSQPSVSKVLSHAELQLGFKLFLRVKGKLVPTSEAHSLIEEVRKIYQQIGTIKKTAENLKEHTHGHIRVVCMPALGLNLLPLAIERFHAKYPQITFDVQTKHYGELIDSLYEHENDLGVVFTDRDHPGIESRQIGSGELVHVSTDGVTKADSDNRIKLSDISADNYISIFDSGPLGDLLNERFTEDKHPIPNAFIRAQTYYMAKSLVSRGLGYSILDEFTANALGMENVVSHGFTPPVEFELKCFYHGNHPLSKASEDFLEYIKTAFEDLHRLNQETLHKGPA
ncbi:LysR substrate-binding domain-containing protein [Porticoccus sp. W117]|uniref:LysR family transcriptional regulator n=1 Tax=Porticoccus sp. W117 TaxID=3054777 RepID=UPI002593BB66|nr:LysR substrate-binding domain-containing protein [Porticoccus sp. W117]MDM3871121.1 LysR substrate-binding domain-containing protein [Porticoccus sp. W117]